MNEINNLIFQANNFFEAGLGIGFPEGLKYRFIQIIESAFPEKKAKAGCPNKFALITSSNIERKIIIQQVAELGGRKLVAQVRKKVKEEKFSTEVLQGYKGIPLENCKAFLKDIDDMNGNELMNLVEKGELDQLKTLFESKLLSQHYIDKKSKGKYPLEVAIKTFDPYLEKTLKYSDIALLLLKHGANPNLTTKHFFLEEAFLSENIEVFKALLSTKGINLLKKNQEQKTIFEILADEDPLKDEFLRALLDFLKKQGAFDGEKTIGVFDREKARLLESAYSKGNISLLKVLFEEEILDQENDLGRTLLHYAAQDEDVEFLKKVLDDTDSKKNIDEIDFDGHTPLMLAVQEEHILNVIELLKHKPDLDVQNCDDTTAVALAVSLGNPTLFRILFTAGADLSACAETLDSISSDKSKAELTLAIEEIIESF